MGKSIGLQLRTMLNKRGFWFSFLLVLIYNLFSYLHIVFSNATGTPLNPSGDLIYFLSANESYSGNVNSSYWGIFSMVFPLICAFPFSFSFILDEKSGINSFYITRMKKQYYIWGKLITCFIGGFIIMFVPFLINLVLCNITFPHNFNTYYGMYYFGSYTQIINGTVVTIPTIQKGILFKQLFIYSPFLYNVLYLIFLSMFAGIIAAFTDCISYFVKKLMILVMLPPYLLFILTRMLGAAYNSIADKYIDFNLMDYFGVGSFLGLSSIYIIIFCVVLISFSVVSSKIVINKDMI